MTDDELWEAMTPTGRHDILSRLRQRMFDHTMRRLSAAGQWLGIPEADDLARQLRRERAYDGNERDLGPSHHAAAFGCTGVGEPHPDASREAERIDGRWWVTYWHRGEKLRLAGESDLALAVCTAVSVAQPTPSDSKDVS